MGKHIPRDGCSQSNTGKHWWFELGDWLNCRYCGLMITKPAGFVSFLEPNRNKNVKDR